MGLWIFLIVLLLVIGAGVGYYLYIQAQNSPAGIIGGLGNIAGQFA